MESVYRAGSSPTRTRADLRPGWHRWAAPLVCAPPRGRTRASEPCAMIASLRRPTRPWPPGRADSLSTTRRR